MKQVQNFAQFSWFTKCKRTLSEIEHKTINKLSDDKKKQNLNLKIKIFIMPEPLRRTDTRLGFYTQTEGSPS